MTAKSQSRFHSSTCQDFFNGVKMKKYRMTESNKCERCQQSETTEHLLWECRWSRIAWGSFNKEIISRGAKDRLASTSITIPHCKGQIILWPDTMILTKLSTHMQQVVHIKQKWTTYRDMLILYKPRLTVGYTRGHPIWTSHGHALDSKPS